MRPKMKVRLGDLLVENEIISQQQLESALAEQKKSGRKLGRVLIDSGFIEETPLLEFLSRQLRIPYVDVGRHEFSPEVVALLPEMLARRFRAVALEERDGELVVGMADPTDIFAYDELSRSLRRPFAPAVVSESALLRAFDAIYRRTEEIENLAEALGEELSEGDIDLGQLAESDNVRDAPVVRLIQSLFEDAVQVGASDIHIEPDEGVLRIRQRVDGLLQEQVMDEWRIAASVVLRLKLMAGLDISERRLPQDGRFSVKVRDRTVDVRISTMPLTEGEGVVMRLLDKSAGMFDLDKLGMPGSLRRSFERAIARPRGMVLVTGPTGSGKTTTLYSALELLNRPELKIVSIEDPVEYRLARVNQVQTHAEIGLDFARVLRGVLRLDPDVVLIGEMRDEETVEIGLRAAMTGHLVLSTLHTNDAASTVNRLIDMGAPGYLVASALTAVLSQRLIRRVCENCAEPYEPDASERAWLRRFVPHEFVETARLSYGTGCHQCGRRGYKGRLGVYEMLSVDEELRLALAGGETRAVEEAARRQMEGRTLEASTLTKALQGETTLEEVFRLMGEIDDEEEIEEAAHPVHETLFAEALARPA